MHELSIAASIVEIVIQEAQKAKATTVSKIDLEIGDLSGIVLEALEFAMESSIKNTIMENASVIFHKKIGMARCNSCSEEFECPSFYEACPKCGSFENQVTQGQEMNVKSLVVE